MDPEDYEDKLTRVAKKLSDSDWLKAFEDARKRDYSDPKWPESSHDRLAGEIEKSRSHANQLNKRVAQLEQELALARCEANSLRLTANRFVRIAFNLFKRTPHQPACEASAKMLADCTCGLGDLESELTKQAARIVHEAMVANG